jgi:hypothetical protein
MATSPEPGGVEAYAGWTAGGRKPMDIQAINFRVAGMVQQGGFV